MCHAPVLGVSTDQVYLLTLHLQSSLGRVHGERAWGKPSTFHTSVNYCCEIARCLLTHFGCEGGDASKKEWFEGTHILCVCTNYCMWE